MGDRICAVTTCQRPHSAKGYCTRHYQRFRLYGDAEAPPQPRRTTGRFIHSTGYAFIRIASGDWRYEHRVIWEHAYGPILDGWHVHHINHVRDDNRLENLQLVRGVDHNRRHTTQRHESGDLNNRGGRSPRYRPDLNDAEIVRRVEGGESFRSIGRNLGAAHNVIANHYRRTLEAA